MRCCTNSTTTHQIGSRGTGKAFLLHCGHVCLQPLERPFTNRTQRSELITVPLLLALSFGGLDADLFVILLQRRQVLTGLGELPLLHTLSDVPMHEGTLRVHEVELMVNP